jgi:hypothetical protein
VFAAHPIRDLRFYDLAEGVPTALATQPEIARVESLRLSHSHDSADPRSEVSRRTGELDALLASREWVRLRELEVYTSSPWHCPPAWLRYPAFAGLDAVSIHPSRDEFGDVLAELATDPIPRLRRLALSWWPGHEYDAGATAFTRSTTCGRLSGLRISYQDRSRVPWGDLLTPGLERLEVSAGSGTLAHELTAALARNVGTGRLAELRLWGIVLTDTNPARCLEQGYMVGAREVVLSYAQLSDADLLALAQSPALARITRLDVSGYQSYNWHGLRTLLSSPHLSQVRHIAFEIPRDADIGVALKFLAEAGTPRRLRSLRVDSRNAGGEVVPVELTAGAGFPELHTLNFICGRTPLSVGAIQELVTSPQLPSLRSVQGVFTSLSGVRSADWTRVPPGVWVGGSLAYPDEFSWASVAVRPANVFLPNHIDEPRW